MDVLRSIYVRLQFFFKACRNRIDRKRLINTDFSIITNHCMGGFIYHDLGLKFLSPTINLKILPDDFIEVLEHLEYYLNHEIVEAHISNSPCPVGKIPKLGVEGEFIFIHFVHYKTFDEAVEKWKQRSSRINWKNIVVMMTARDGCKESTLQRFENLPYEKRICFTLHPYPKYKHCKYACLDNGKPLKGYISDMVNIWGKRAFECNGFDYIRFLS